MTSLALPPELLAIIVSESDVQTLKTLRLTNRLLSSFATKSLFSEISLFPKDESCQVFESILKHPEIKDQVRKVHLNTVEDDYPSDDDAEELEPPTRWQKLLTKLSNLSHLESIVLRFDKNCTLGENYITVAQPNEYRETLIRWLGTGLVSLRQPLKELGIRNQQNITPLSEDFQKVLPKLRTLRLNAVHELIPHCPESELEADEVEEFYEKILPSVWLKPTMGSLQKLSLYSNLYWGFYPSFSLEGIHLPNLQSLALGNFAFFHDKQLDWILSHSSTLEELYLDDCPIISHVRILEDEVSRYPIPISEMKFKEEQIWSDSWRYTYPRRWSDYFAAFEAGLLHLRHFALGHSEAWYFTNGLPFEQEEKLLPLLADDRYMAFDSGVGPSQFIVLRESGDWDQRKCPDEDREALKALYRTIRQKLDCGEFAVGGIRVKDLVQV